jgi:hypothetical protein
VPLLLLLLLLPAVESGGDLVEFGLGVSLEDVLSEGIRRLQDKGTWKVWQFGNTEFFDQESFRSYLHTHHLPQELLHLLPKDDPKGPERPAEAALRQRMSDLLQQVGVFETWVDVFVVGLMCSWWWGGGGVL